MNRKLMVLGAALIAVPFLTSVVMSQTTSAPADAPTTAPAAASQPAPKELADSIQKAIDLLSAGKVKETIQLLAPPEDLARESNKDGGLDKMVEQFKTSGMDAKLLTALKAAKDQNPRISDDGKHASYPQLDNSTPPLEFTKINDGWYLR